jgi:hypothetical protein
LRIAWKDCAKSPMFFHGALLLSSRWQASSLYSLRGFPRVERMAASIDLLRNRFQPRVASSAFQPFDEWRELLRPRFAVGFSL